MKVVSFLTDYAVVDRIIDHLGTAQPKTKILLSRGFTTDRPYRKGKPPWEALQEIVAQTGHQFDPEVVEAFRRVISTRFEQIEGRKLTPVLR